MKVDRVINQAIWEHQANTKGFPNNDYLNDLEKIRKALEIIKPIFQDIYYEENEDGEIEMLLRVANSNKPILIGYLKSKEEYDLLKEVLL